MVKMLKILAAIFVLMNVHAVKADNYEQQHKKKAREHTEKQNKIYEKLLRDISSTSEAVALRRKRFEEDESFRLQLHREDMARLEKQLAAESAIPRDDKENLLAVMEGRYQQTVKDHRAMMEQEIAFLMEISSDTAITRQERQKKMRGYMEKNRREYEKYCESTRTEGGRIVRDFFRKYR